MRNERDTGVLATLIANHREFLAFVERRTRDRAAAEDVLQDAFGRAMTAVAHLRRDEAAIAWFYRLLRNAVVDHQRRSAVREKVHVSAAREADVASANEGEPCQCVARLAVTLRPELELAIRRVDVEGAPIATFASEAGITANNARVRLFRARAALRERVRSSCGACADHGCTECSCAPCS